VIVDDDLPETRRGELRDAGAHLVIAGEPDGRPVDQRP
jgi:hypothetical protein